jgi:hypothetical protein
MRRPQCWEVRQHIAALHDLVPPEHPLLAAGERGSAKTVLAKILRAPANPNVAPVRTMPREERDLFIAASVGVELPDGKAAPARQPTQRIGGTSGNVGQVIEDR